MSVYSFSTGAIIQFDTRTITNLGQGQYLKIVRDAPAYTNVKGGLGDSAYLANIDATKFTITLSLFKGSEDAKFLTDIYNENLLAFQQNDYAILSRTHTITAKTLTSEFTGSNIKISNMENLVVADSQNSGADEVSKVIFTFICPDGFLI